LKLSPELSRKLTNEFRYCAEKMSKERDFRRKLFLYSNLGDTVSSVLDFEYDSQLVFIVLLLDVSYSTIASRVETIIDKKDTSVELIPGLFDKLCGYLDDLAAIIEANQDTYKTLEKLAELATTTTERGYYLYTKGSLKI